MAVIPDVNGTTLVEFSERYIESNSTTSSDKYRSYKALAAEGYTHEPKEFSPKENPDHLKWLHTIISNAKAFIGGTYHGLGAKHMPSYLSEYCYRFNRRTMQGEPFNRLLSCCVATKATTYPELTG